MVSCSGCQRMMRCACVSLHAEDRDGATLAELCHDDLHRLRVLRAAVLSTRSLLVHVTISSKETHSQRKRRDISEVSEMRFTFHDESAAPLKIDAHLWNCSVDYRSDLLYHFACDLLVDCHDGADEARCPYTTALCGPGFLTLGGACFFYVTSRGAEQNRSRVGKRDRRKTSWISASDLCRGRMVGGRLAVLNTPSKWRQAELEVFSRQPNLNVLVGIRSTPPTLPLWYYKTNQWVDGTTDFYLHSKPRSIQTCMRTCGYIKMKPYGFEREASLYLHKPCTFQMYANILCEKPLPLPHSAATAISINGTDRWPLESGYVRCPLGHYTHPFLACDVSSSCWLRAQASRCQWPMTPPPPSFACANPQERVPYTLVCDHRADCSDSSDEDFCRFGPCLAGQFTCDNGQCISSLNLCDGWVTCYEGDDEWQCKKYFKRREPLPPPAVVTLTEYGLLAVLPLNTTRPQADCPRTHFPCLRGYCVPLLLRCNGHSDCPGREDEAGCDTCPGFYRCRASKICLEYSHLCDGHAHCPQHDDELLCNETCPPFCLCRGLAFFCRRSFVVSVYPLLRYLDASGSDVIPGDLAGNRLVIHLALANCGLVSLSGLRLPNLLSLNVQDNQLSVVSHKHLFDVPQLRDLSVAGNPLSLMFGGTEDLGKIVKLDLSHVAIHVLNVTVLSAFPNLRDLNLSHSGMQRVQGEGFHRLEQLRVVDLRGCHMTWFPRGLFHGLSYLQTVHADSFKLCCPRLLPLDFNLKNCFAPSSDVSSCDNLLRRTEYSVCACALCLFAMVGNAVSFIFRTYFSNRKNKLGYGSFVTHLSVSDFFMGVYLAVIAVADQVYRSTYLWNDVSWRHSVTCQLSGSLSLLSSEVSALIMCLITLDRFLVLRFPFSWLHFTPRSAHMASAVVWVCGVLLVSVPLLPSTSHWQFYSQTGICIPLPITRTHFAGHGYSFGVLVVLNFGLFVFVSMGQLSIYWSIRVNSMSVSNTTKKTKDLTIARRLITVATTNFLCWFPIGVLGLLASNGVAIPGEVNVAMVIFVLPLNSAANPCLYTFSVITERRQRVREERLRVLLLSQLKATS